ncbi:MAG: methyltransferase [Elusimicrobiota bacterium]
MREFEVEFSKIVYEGKALGRKDGKVIFAYGALAGEKAIVKPIFEKKNYIEAEVVSIIDKSKFRIDPIEDHFLSCSPWQIIKYEKQVEFKKRLIEESLFQTSKETIMLNDFIACEKKFGYRTKIEYSFMEDEDGIFLAFHKRGDYSKKVKLINGCALIDNEANTIALDILKKINKLKIPLNILKTLIMRRAETEAKIIASLFIKDRELKFEFEKENLRGFNLVYSNPKTSISTVDEILYKEGEDYLIEKICGKKIYYGFDCFFQNNIPLFEKAILEIKKEISAANKVLDLYSGVGVIGICLADISKEITLIDLNKSSIEFAKKNIEINSITNAKAFCFSDSKIDLDFFDVDVLILDPPRAGIHKNTIKNIMKALPQKIVYLSCNPITQGRDMCFFLEKYKVIKTIGFDFYPNTPHMESLIILERK